MWQLMDAVNQLALDAAAMTALPVMHVKYLFALLSIYPLALAFRLLFPVSSPASSWGATAKHLFSVMVAIGLCSFALGPYTWAHTAITATVSYFLLRFLPHNISHQAVFVFCMAYLWLGHLWLMYTEWLVWSLNWTTQQMLLTIKLTSCACNIYDGHQPSAVQEKMSDYQRKHAIKRMPSLLEFLGFAFFFPTFLTGPTMEMSDYLAYVDGSMFSDCGGRPPHSWLPTLKTFLKAVLCLPGPVLGNLFFPTENFLTKPFLEAPLLVKCVEIWLTLFLVRAKYYFGWYMGESGLIACGFNYNGRDKAGNTKWDRVINIRPFGVEVPENMREITDSWNICTSSWLKQYIYLRYSPDGKPNTLATIITYAVSAFWHGFYPGYFMFFLMGAVLTETGKDLRRKVRPWFMKKDGVTPKPYKIIYDTLGVIVTQAALSWIAVSFVLLIPSAALAVYASMYHIGYILIFGTFITVRFLLPTPPRSAVPHTKAQAKPLSPAGENNRLKTSVTTANPKAKMIR